jgi:hypothetical protein
VLQWGEQSARKVHVKKKGEWSHLFYLKGRGSFTDCPGVPKLWFGYFTTRVKLHGQWGPRLEISVRSGWIRLLECLSWIPGVDVAGAWDGSWGCLCFAVLYLDAKSSHVGTYVDGLAYHLHHPTDYGWQTWEQSPLTGVIASHHVVMGGMVWEHLSVGCEAPGTRYMTWCWLLGSLLDRIPRGDVRLY